MRAPSPGLIVLNAGSSSLKFSLFEDASAPSSERLLCQGEATGLGEAPQDGPRLRAVDRHGQVLEDRCGQAPANHEAALESVLAWIGGRFAGLPLAAVGHRLVHGGSAHTAPVLIDPKVIANLRELVPLAPLHQPPALAAIAAMARLHPGLPQVACFDTAFHSTQPLVASTFALPRELTSEGLRRYGFHGLSCEHIAAQLPGLLGERADGRVVIAHEAIDLFVYRIGRELGSLAAALGGLDALVFTAGIGEHASEIRSRVCEQARWLGLHLDPAANAAHGPRITRADSPASAWVIATDEALVIARHTALLCGSAASPQGDAFQWAAPQE